MSAGVNACGVEHPLIKGRRCQLDVNSHEHRNRPWHQRRWHFAHDGRYGYSWKPLEARR